MERLGEIERFEGERRGDVVGEGPRDGLRERERVGEGEREGEREGMVEGGGCGGCGGCGCGLWGETRPTW